MPSSYSPLLRLELIGSGEQAGLWGETTNKNLGALLEQAIAGVTTISLSGGAGTFTLITLNGTQDQARSAVLRFIGNPSGDKIIEIPSVEKLYVARNESGRKITFKTSSQISNPLLGGVELLDGEATLVFCDGSAARAGIQTVGVGTLTVPGGGTGATSFTGGFVKSPGGTGNLTSSSTVNLATEVSGTLPVANGGTGTTSFTQGRLLVGNGTSGVSTLGGSVVGQIATWDGTQWVAQTPSSGGVSSFNGRTGAVSPQSSDYSSFYPSTTGSGASGTWSINISGNAATASSATTASSANSVPFSGVTSKPTTLSGYGITDAVNTSGTQTVGGVKTFTSQPVVAGLRTSTGAINFSSAGGESVYYAGGEFVIAIGFTAKAVFESDGDLRISGANATKASGTTWINPSDARIKDNITDYAKGLSVLDQIKVRTWVYNGKGGSTKGTKGLGLIADELLSVLPEAVSEMDAKLNPEDSQTTKIKAVDASEITWLLVKSVQELSEKVKSLEAQLAAK